MFNRHLGKTSRPLAVLFVASAMQVLAGCHDTSTASTAASAPVAASNMGALEAGVNRQGRDLSEFGVHSADAARCAGLCAVDQRCKAMSFMSRPPPDEGICWLKGSVPEATPNPATVSAVKIAPG